MWRGRGGAVPGAGGVAVVVAVPGELEAQGYQVVEDGGGSLAGDERGDGRIAGHGAGAVAVQPGAAGPAALGRAGAGGGPLAPDPLGPLVLEPGIGVHKPQVGQRHQGERLHRLPGPLRQQPARQQASHRVCETVVVPLLPSPVITGPRRGGQGVQDRADIGGAFGGQVPAEHSCAVQGGVQADRPVLETAAVLIRPGRTRSGQDLRKDLCKPGQVHACAGGGDEDLIGRVPAVIGQAVGPLADRPGPRLRQPAAVGHRGHNSAVPVQSLGPGHAPGGGTPGDLSPVIEPRPSRIRRIRMRALPGSKRRQESRSCCSGHRLGLLQS